MLIAQYLDDMILEREKANDALREELTKYVGWCQMLDQSQVGLSFVPIVDVRPSMLDGVKSCIK